MGLLLIPLMLLTGLLPAASAPDPAPSRDWQTIRGGAGTGCALGGPFRFFYRPGADSEPLLIYFQGGGACWSWVSCSGMFDTTVEPDEPAHHRGIFDLSSPDNPFRDHAVLFIPYCTGDVHVGDAAVRYGDEADAPPVAHRGADNVNRALDWLQEHHPAPGHLAVAGASAGAYGAVFHAPGIARRYPDARLVVIADSGVPLLHDYPAILERWGAGHVLRGLWQAAGETPLSLERAYREAATSPGVTAVAVLTSDRDSIQSAFYLISGSPAWRERTYGLLDRMDRRLARLHTFVVEGSDHGLMRTDSFHGYRAGGQTLSSWLARILAGEKVGSVRCESCVP